MQFAIHTLYTFDSTSAKSYHKAHFLMNNNILDQDKMENK